MTRPYDLTVEGHLFCECGHQLERHILHEDGFSASCTGPSCEEYVPCTCSEFRELRLGVYQHYKGGIYDVLGVGYISNDRVSPLVSYFSRKHRVVWHHTPEEFLKMVTCDGTEVPRFNYIGGAKDMEDIWKDLASTEEEKVELSIRLLRDRFFRRIP